MRSQEESDIFSWRWKCHGVLKASEALLQISHGLSRSCRLLFGDCLRSYCASFECTALSGRPHRTDGVLKITQRRRSNISENAVQSQCKHHRQAHRSHCGLWARLRSSCGVLGDITALLWQPFGDLTALLSACSKCAPSLCVLCDPNVTAAMLAIVLRAPRHSAALFLDCGVAARTRPSFTEGNNLRKQNNHVLNILDIGDTRC